MNSLYAKILKYFAKGESISLRIVLFRMLCVLIAFLCIFLVIPSNMLQQVSPYLNPVVAVYSILILIIYRVSRSGKHLVKTMYLLTLLLLNISWFLNGGSTGSISYFYLTAVIFPLILFSSLTRICMLLIMILNFTALIIIEQNFPGIIVPFISINDRYLDLLTGFAVSTLISAIIYWLIISGYDIKLLDHERSEKELNDYKLNLEEYVQDRTIRLQESEERFRSLVENINDIVFTLSPEGYFSYVSPNWKEAFGYELSETLDHPFAPFVHPDDVAGCQAALQQVMATGVSQGEVEYRVIRKDGTTVWYAASASLARNAAGNELEFLGVGRDISERKKVEEEKQLFEQQFLQAQKLESLGIMAGGIAHDFNNLLQSMLGNLELAVSGPEADPGLREHLSTALIAGRQAAELTNLMLTYAGKGAMYKKSLNLNVTVRENISILKSAVTTAMNLELALFEELPEIYADTAQIQQVVMNLITNAAESIEKPPGVIIVTTGIMECSHSDLASSLVNEKTEPGQFVSLEICDNGCGMNQETLARLFDPFFTTKLAGRGLGMSAVLGIIKSHGGALFVESEPSKGTRFRVLFPVMESVSSIDNAEVSDAMSYITGSKDDQRYGIVLVVDDEKSVLRTCANMVRFCGFEAITATSGNEAINKFRKNIDSIDVVLMDLTMPNMDGLTAMSAIRDIKPDVKVLLATGFNEEELSRRILNNPPSGFVRKPYSMATIKSELHNLMSNRISTPA
jgi:PAS domain S-box-containing protein